jgi:hypothetical protein
MIKERHSNTNALVIFVFLITTTAIISLPTLSMKKSFAEDNNWYAGEGVTKDMYVKYRMSHIDTNNGRIYNDDLFQR